MEDFALLYLKKEGFGKSFKEVDEMFHSWYVIRRKWQLHVIDLQKFTEQKEMFIEKYEEMFDQDYVSLALKYITERTERDEKSKYTIR